MDGKGNTHQSLAEFSAAARNSFASARNAPLLTGQGQNMKCSFLSVLASCVVLGTLYADTPPSAKERAHYVDEITQAVKILNAHREAIGRQPLQPLTELCSGAREYAASEFLPGAPIVSNVFDHVETKGFTGNALSSVTLSNYVDGEELALDILHDPDLVEMIENPNAEFIGIGAVLIVVENEYTSRWCVVTGREGAGAAPYGTTGVETDSGWGFPHPENIAEPALAIVSGNSRDGFTYDSYLLPLSLIEAYRAALQDVKKAKISTSVGKRVVYKVPRPIWRAVKRLTLKGKLPTGLKFQALTGKLTGRALAPGRYNVKIGGDLIAEIDNKTKMKPYKVKIIIK